MASNQTFGGQSSQKGGADRYSFNPQMEHSLKQLRLLSEKQSNADQLKQQQEESKRYTMEDVSARSDFNNLSDLYYAEHERLS